MEVSSQSPAEVVVGIDPGAEYTKLTPDPLVHDTDPSVPALVGTSIESEPGVVRVRIAVPNDQPAGRYVGAIIDATGGRRGELVVHLKAPPAPRARARRR